MDLLATKALLVAAASAPPVPAEPPRPRGAIARFATSINVDPNTLRGILGTNWTLETGWVPGIGMALGPTITQKSGSPRVQIKVTAGGTHKAKPDMELTLSLAPSEGEWISPAHRGVRQSFGVELELG